ncbi:hypothetical protein [Streptomyces sp. NPDC059916]|uniref:hypothetical protein n=1 Tax=Streptomyces sp. NPDC059916 TaxID=3347001 RepID=UPI0036CE1EEC
MLSDVPVRPRPRPTREGIAAGSALPLAAVALAFLLSQLPFVAPGLHLAWDESVYTSHVAPHVPSAYFSAPRARGLPVLIAPLTLLTSSTLALRVYLAVLSGTGLFVALWVWRRLRRMPVLALAGTLFAGLWVTQLYGPQAMPNLWTALSALTAVGCFLRAAANHSDRRALIGLCLALAAAALFRPTDALWLSLPMAAAGLGVRNWRRPALLAALVAGLALGGAQWVVEAYLSYGGVAARLHRASTIEASTRGLRVRIHYLDSKAGRAELRAQGVTDRAMRSWFKGKSRPGKANLERLDSAYWVRRRENLIRSGWLKRHLDNDGQGRRMEIYPVDQSAVTPSRARTNITERSITVRYVWADMVDAWADKGRQPDERNLGRHHHRPRQRLRRLRLRVLRRHRRLTPL